MINHAHVLCICSCLRSYPAMHKDAVPIPVKAEDGVKTEPGLPHVGQAQVNGIKPEAADDAVKAGPTAKPAVQYINPNRPPCMWMVLQPVLPDGQQPTAEDLVVVPIHIDATLPDYIVRAEIYEKGMVKRWAAGERFRMYFGGKVRNSVQLERQQTGRLLVVLCTGRHLEGCTTCMGCQAQ